MVETLEQSERSLDDKARVGILEVILDGSDGWIAGGNGEAVVRYTFICFLYLSLHSYDAYRI